jgi:hypothetical protein
MSIESIKKRLQIISDQQEEINKVKALLDESLDDNPEYQQIQEDEMKHKDEVRNKKFKVLSQPQYKDMAEQLRQLRTEQKENKEILAQDLADYYKDTGMLEIADDEGNTKRIKFSVKLINS